MIYMKIKHIRTRNSEDVCGKIAQIKHNPNNITVSMKYDFRNGHYLAIIVYHEI